MIAFYAIFGVQSPKDDLFFALQIPQSAHLRTDPSPNQLICRAIDRSVWAHLREDSSVSSSARRSVERQICLVIGRRFHARCDVESSVRAS
jgi:hypothetical protein